MVSRRKILSRSRDELHSDIYFMNEDDDEDVWYSKDKLYRVRHIFKFSREFCKKLAKLRLENSQNCHQLTKVRIFKMSNHQNI